MPEAKRCRVVRTRLSDDEFSALRERATDCGLTLSAYLRQTALGAVPRARPHRLHEKTVYHLARLGERLNQLARHANTTQRLELTRDLTEVLAELRATLGRIA